MSSAKPDLGEVFKVIAAAVPYFGGTVVVWVVVLAAELLFCVHAWRRARSVIGAAGASTAAPNRRLEWLAAAGPLVYLVAMMAAALIARAHILGALRDGPTEARVPLLTASLEGLLNALPFGIQAAVPLALLAAYAIGVNAWARHRATGADVSRRRFVLGAFLVAAVGLGPIARAFLQYFVALIKITAGVAGVDPEMKATMLAFRLREAREGLDHAVLIGVCTFLAVIAVLGFEWWRTTASSSDNASAGRTRAAVRLAAGTLVAAALLFVVALPFRAENHAPWPEPSRSSALNVGAFEPSAIVGPDPVPWAPVLFVEPDRILLDGAPGSTEDVYDWLSILRNNYTLLHPGAEFPGELNVYCAAAVPARALDQALAVAAAAGYRKPSLIWARTGQVVRPLLGAVPRPSVTAATLSVLPEGRTGWLDVAAAGTCGAFGEGVASWRRKGTTVQLKLTSAARP